MKANNSLYNVTNDHNKYFKTDHLSSNLGRHSVRGGAVIVLSQVLKFFLGISSTAVLARLLEPSDFGLLAMVTAITANAALFYDAGLSKATIQRPMINQSQVSNLFWINMFFGFLIFLLVCSLAPFISWFYKEPKLLHVTFALAFSYPILSLSVQHQALLRRQMKFVPISIINVLSNFLGIICGIIFALSGAKYWSLVAITLLTSFSSTILTFFYCRWRPNLPKRGADIKSMVTFGVNISVNSFLNKISRTIDNILIGRLYGSFSLGIYAKAYKLLLLPMTQINTPMSSVAIPSLSILQNDPIRYREFYRKGIEIISFLGKPLVVLLFIVADEIILLFLGNQWTQTIPVFRALCPAALMATTNVATGWVFISMGHADRQLKWGIFSSLFFSASIIAGLHWGILGVAYAVSISRLLLKIPGLLYCYSKTPITLGDFLIAIWRPSFSALFSGFILFFIGTHFFSNVSILFLKLVLNSFLFMLLYLLFYIILPNGFAHLKQNISYLKKLKK